MAKPEKEEAETEREGTTDGPLLDLSDDAVKKMIKAAKKRGYVTMDELNSVLPSEQTDPDRIEDIMSMLSDMGINVVEDDEQSDEAETPDTAADAEEDANELAEQTGTAVATVAKKEPTDRTDDPVRMYLREMGSVELLSREGEIAIAKRIEAGRETMIAGLCESPLTFQAIIIWRDELNEAKILLREIIDLEATYAGPEAKQAPVVVHTDEDRAKQEEARSGRRTRDDDDITNVGGESRLPEEEEDDEDEASLSLAAMEAELRPQVMETLDVIADTYKKLRKLQDQQVENRLAAAGTLSPSQDRRLKELKDQLIKAVKSLSLNQARIEALVEQLYDINKRLVQNEGKLLAPGRKPWRQARGIPQGVSGFGTRPELDEVYLQSRRQGLEGIHQEREGDDPGTSLRRFRTSPPKPRSRSPSSAASSTRSRRASGKPRSPRRKWSRRTCASSSPSRKSTPIVACSSSTSSRRAISA